MLKRIHTGMMSLLKHIGRGLGDTHMTNFKEFMNCGQN